MRRNDEQGWEEISLLLALGSTTPVRYQFTKKNGNPRAGGYINSAEGTICAKCISSQRGKTFVTDVLMQYPKIADYVFMKPPPAIRPTSRNTYCKVCSNPAFPELIKHTKRP